MMAVMTEARTTDVELKGHTSLSISDVRQTSHCVGAEQVGGLSCEVGDGGDVLVFAGDGGDVVAGGGVVVGGGGGVMMVSCGHAELLVWNLTSARCNQSSEVIKLNCRISNVCVDSPCMQYLTKCSQDLVSVLINCPAITNRLLGSIAKVITYAAISHSKQENATTSTASTPV